MWYCFKDVLFKSLDTFANGFIANSFKINAYLLYIKHALNFNKTFIA